MVHRRSWVFSVWVLPLVLIPIAGRGAGPEPGRSTRIRGLIAQLGSDRFSDREAAGRALDRIGAPALPPLIEATRSDDPEIRRRAEVLVLEIQKNQAVSATPVRLDLRGCPLDQAVADLARQAGVKLLLQPAQNPSWQRPITLQTGPTTFWQALDELCRAGRVWVQPGGSTPGTGQPVLHLYPGTLNGPRPAHSGPFRVRVCMLSQSKQVYFTPQPQHSQQFTIQFEVTAEPRIRMLGISQVQILDAVDDRDQSMTPPASPNGVHGFGVQTSYYLGNVAAISQTVQGTLHPPHRLGTTIRRLRGLIPVDLVIDHRQLFDVAHVLMAKDKRLSAGGARLRLVDVNRENDNQVQVHLAFQPPPGITPDLWVRMIGNELQLTDGAGRPYQFAGVSQSNIGTTVDANVIFMATVPGLGPPDRLTVAVLKHAAIDVPFELHDIPLP